MKTDTATKTSTSPAESLRIKTSVKAGAIAIPSLLRNPPPIRY